MKRLLHQFLDIPATERRGILALVFAIMLVHTIRIVYPKLLSDNYPLTEAEALQFAEWIAQHDTSLGIVINPLKSTKSATLLSPFKFNPNTLPHDDWLRLGFSEREAGSVAKYIQKGGQFKVRSDLQKLFFIDSVEYTTLYQWIDLPENQQAFRKNQVRSTVMKKARPVPIELNSADTTTLQTLRGIGPYWARRIVRHRDRLGGFYRKEQLLEMKGFGDSLYQIIAPQLTLDTTLLRFIVINSAPDEEILNHPYGWYGVGKSIVNYRAKHKPLKDADDLRKIIAIKPEQLERFLPYLKFE
ncbi:MAG: helix-hairpin-helix domain-containing protein [Bacteroidia bacterium]|jgi:DNA uptake protein ComE-like DNA-binding protein|nr:helix-hairpin-helix domain-containing protein [Bacteroidia bacterium]MCC6768537.1 helix-hairpin-helix domain-containing protein [Bacteroidia bacterium]